MHTISDCIKLKKSLDKYYENFSVGGDVYFSSNDAVYQRKILARDYFNCREYIRSHCAETDLIEITGKRKVNIIQVAINEDFSEANYCLPKAIDLIQNVLVGKEHSYEEFKNFELSLRKFINFVLTNAAGVNWLSDNKHILIHKDIINKLSKKLEQQNKIALFETIKGRELEFFDFSDYETIIMNNFNLFQDYFSLNKEEKKEIERRFKSIRDGLRNPIAHPKSRVDPLLKKDADVSILWFERAFRWAEK